MINERNKQFLISIIIATYNAEKYIAECLNSIAKQSTLSIEVIVVDGASNDGTLEIVKNFKAHSLKWISEPDKGIYDALNKGIERATGKWLYFQGADDRLLPGFTELANKLKNEDTVYYGNSIAWYEHDKAQSSLLLKGEFSKYRLAKYCMNHQSILYPAKAFYSDKYELKYKILADYAFNIRLWGNKRFKKEFYPIDIVKYHMEGISAQFSDPVFEHAKPILLLKGMGLKVFLRYLFRVLKDKIRN